MMAKGIISERVIGKRLISGRYSCICILTSIRQVVDLIDNLHIAIPARDVSDVCRAERVLGRVFSLPPTC
jgi:hypothetical protein